MPEVARNRPQTPPPWRACVTVFFTDVRSGNRDRNACGSPARTDATVTLLDGAWYGTHLSSDSALAWPALNVRRSRSRAELTRQRDGDLRADRPYAALSRTRGRSSRRLASSCGDRPTPLAVCEARDVKGLYRGPGGTLPESTAFSDRTTCRRRRRDDRHQPGHGGAGRRSMDGATLEVARAAPPTEGVSRRDPRGTARRPTVAGGGYSADRTRICIFVANRWPSRPARHN